MIKLCIVYTLGFIMATQETVKVREIRGNLGKKREKPFSKKDV